MICRSVQNSLSALLDGSLPGDARQNVLKHLARCGECALAYEQLLEVLQALKELPMLSPPEHLAMSLAAMASRERERRLNRRNLATWVEHRGEQARLWVDNLMRPLALPLAGGLLSALLLFSILVPSIAFSRHPILRDVPISIFTEAALKSQSPFGFNDDDFVLEVLVDEQGRMVDYTVAEGLRLDLDPQLQRSIENNLLFTEFHPATAFGQPTSSKMFVSFKRSHYTVKS
jgi:hypothetical protein